jgi:hypothetical protein
VGLKLVDDGSIVNGAGNPLGAGGGFGAQQTFASGTDPYSVVTPDIDGNGKLDLIATNWGSGNGSVMLGNGNGTFQATSSTATAVTA